MKTLTTNIITKKELQNIKRILDEASEDDYAYLEYLKFLKATIEKLENGKEINESETFMLCENAIPELLNYELSKLTEQAKYITDMRDDFKEITYGTIKLEDTKNKEEDLTEKIIEHIIVGIL